MRTAKTSRAPDADTAPARTDDGREPGWREPAAGPDVSSSEQIARLFEMTSDLLATISKDGRFQLVNPAWEHVLGWTPEELASRPAHDLLHPEDVEKTRAMMFAEEGSRRISQNFTNRYLPPRRDLALAAVERASRRRHLVCDGQGRDGPDVAGAPGARRIHSRACPTGCC